MGKGEPFCIVGRNADWCSHCGKQYGDNLKKINMDLPLNPAIPLLEIYLKEPKTLFQKNISIPIFIAALFTIGKIWKQPSCPSVDDWINQLWDIYTMEYYSAIKKENFTFCDSMDGPGEHYATWNKPVRERQIPYDLTHMWNLMNKLNWQAKQRQTHRWRTDDSQSGGEGVEGLSKKEKGLMNIDNSVVIAGRRGYKGTKK